MGRGGVWSAVVEMNEVGLFVATMSRRSVSIRPSYHTICNGQDGKGLVEGPTVQSGLLRG